jgi:hypothetical protein
VHVREIQQRPKLLQCLFLVVISNFLIPLSNNEVPIRIIHRMDTFGCEAINHSFNSSQRDCWVHDPNSILYAFEPGRELSDFDFWQVFLDFSDGQGAQLEYLFIWMQEGRSFDDSSQLNVELLDITRYNGELPLPPELPFFHLLFKVQPFLRNQLIRGLLQQ